MVKKGGGAKCWQRGGGSLLTLGGDTVRRMFRAYSVFCSGRRRYCCSDIVVCRLQSSAEFRVQSSDGPYGYPVVYGVSYIFCCRNRSEIDTTRFPVCILVCLEPVALSDAALLGKKESLYFQCATHRQRRKGVSEYGVAILVVE